MTVKLLTEQLLEFLSLKGGCTGSSESTLVKMPHCWKSHVMAQIRNNFTTRALIEHMTLTISTVINEHFNVFYRHDLSIPVTNG